MDDIKEIYKIYNLPEIKTEGITEIEYNHRCKYLRLYIRLVKRCQSMTVDELSGYCEVHHIQSKCLGGTNIKTNLVKMPIRYHIMAHMILVEIYPDCDGLWCSLKLMVFNTIPRVKKTIDEKFSIRTVAYMREKSRMAGENHPNYGKHLSEETRKKISKSHQGKRLSEETKRKMSLSRSGPKNPNYGKRMSEETKKKLSEAHKGYVTSEETKKKLSIALSGPNHPRYGIKVSEEERLRMISIRPSNLGATNGRARKVKGPDGTIYGSIVDAAKESGIPKSTLSKWLHGIRKTPTGWSFYNEDENIETT